MRKNRQLEPKPDKNSLPKFNIYAENNTWNNEFTNLKKNKNDNSYILIRYFKKARLPYYGIVYDNIHEDKYVKFLGNLLENTEGKCGYFKLLFNKDNPKYTNLYKIIDNLDDNDIITGDLIGFALIRENDFANYKIKSESNICLSSVDFDLI